MRPTMVSNGQAIGSMDVASWVTLPFAGERLESVVHFGNGKDAELVLTFVGGRRVTLLVNAVRVEADRGVVVDVSSWDDVSLRIEYLGSDLHLHSGRFGYPGPRDKFDAEFLAEAESWLAAGCEKELLWVAKAELRLASSPSDSSDAA
jgi:hypothetical protein